MKRIQRIKNNIIRHIRLQPEHIGYVQFGDNMLPEYRCPAKDCGFVFIADWVCCPYCGQRFRELKENQGARFIALSLNEEVANAGIREDITGD